MRPKPPTLPERFAAERAAAERSALNALKRARRTADKAGVDLSEWEGEFLGSVEERIREHGRAFADPDKGARGQALSTMQTRKLKEIAAKAAGDDRKPWERKKPNPSSSGLSRGPRAAAPRSKTVRKGGKMGPRDKPEGDEE